MILFIMAGAMVIIMEDIIAILVNESKWFAPSVVLGIICCVWGIYRSGKYLQNIAERINIGMNICM